MPTDTKLNQLIINQLTQEQYDEAKAAGTLSDTELYITDSDDDAQVKSNLSQTIDDSTTKYPSNKAVKDESSRLESIMNTKVNKSGDTMTGNLIINGNIPAYILQDSTLDLSQTYTDYKDDGFVLQRDKNGADGSHIAFTHDQYGNNIIRLVASDGVGQDRKINTIGIWVNKLGPNGTFASQCNYDASIVTTVSHGSNYVRFGNGLQICWGAGNNGQWTFPVPFKDANYGLTMSTQTRHSGEIWISELGLLNKTNTGFYKTDSVNTDPFTWTAIGYWY